MARGHVWRVVRVMPDDPLLMDRTGSRRMATADPDARVIRISTEVRQPLFDQVYLHEAAHAIMEESGVNDLVGHDVLTEELLAWFLETHAIEVIDAVSTSLGRPVCVDGTCLGRR